MINFTNHPYTMRDEEQKKAARAFGEIKEIPFPAVDPAATEEEVDRLAGEYKERILALHDPVVLVQGEFTMSFRLVQLLKEAGLQVVAACSARNAKEWRDEEGKYHKEMGFEFVQFRRY